MGVLLHVAAHEGERRVYLTARSDDGGPVQSGCPKGSSFPLVSRLGTGRLWRLPSELFVYRNANWCWSGLPGNRLSPRRA